MTSFWRLDDLLIGSGGDVRQQVREHLGRFLSNPADVEARIEGWVPFFTSESDWTARENRIASDFGTALVRNDIRSALRQFGITGEDAERQIGSLNPEGSATGYGWVPFFTNESDPVARLARMAQDFGQPNTQQDAGELPSLDYVPSVRKPLGVSSLTQLATVPPSDAPTITDWLNNIRTTDPTLTQGATPLPAWVKLAAIGAALALVAGE